MKKWLIGLMVPALISTASLSTNAATIQNDYSSVKINNGVITIRKNQPQKEQNRVEPHVKNNNLVSYRKENDHRGNNRRDRDRREEQKLMKERDDARYIINRTASVILRAQRVARIHHHYTGFAQSVTHQNRAREFFRAGRYREAIFHSLRARRLAMSVIRSNNDQWAGYGRDDREDFYIRMAPKDNELNIQVDWRKIGGNDEAAVRIQFNLNVN